MKPFRKNIAIAIDGGGIKGAIPVRALMKLEEAMGIPLSQLAGLVAGTSTGSIISAGLAAGLSANHIYSFYKELGQQVFRKSLSTLLWPIARHRYPSKPLRLALHQALGDLRMGELWDNNGPNIDLVITTYDLTLNRTRFIKPWKADYADWLLVDAVMASSAVPTYFPVVDGRYVDGGVGSYSNPCYIAAYEARYCLGWKPEETTLISLGTGRHRNSTPPGVANNYRPWDWVSPTLGAFMTSAADQQVHLVETFFEGLDFRRFQVDLDEEIAMDDPSALPRLAHYGDRMASRILRDQYDCAMGVQPQQIR